MISFPLSIVAAALLAGAQQPTPADPRAVVRAAQRAVQRDSVAGARAGWTTRLSRDHSDRGAALGLATLARLTYDYPAAERLYRRLIADSLRPDRHVAVARLGLARQLEGRGFSVDARPHFTRAREEARAAGDPATEGEALLTLAFIRARTEGLTVGEALLDTAERIIPDSALALRSQHRYRRAIMYSLRGRAADARAEAESSIALARRAGDVRAEADGARALGQVLVYAQQFDSALVILGRAEELFRQARDRGALAAHLVWRAQALGNLGRYGEMREAMQLALAEGEASHNPATVAVAYRALGALAVMMGDFAAAGEHLRKSVAISTQTGDSLGVTTTRKFLADVALAAGDVEGARALALEQLAAARRTEDLRDQFEANSLLAELAMRERNWVDAGRSLGEARAVLATFPGEDHRLWLLHHEGRLAHARGDLDAAERAFAAFRRGFAGRPQAQLAQYDAGVRLADIHAARGDLGRAERELLSATDALDQWRATLNDAELRVLVFQVSPSQHARAADPTELDARAARVLAALAAGGRGEAAFALAERRRARELRDRLVRAAALRTAVSSSPSVAVAGGVDRSASITASELSARIPDDRTAVLEFVGGVGGAPVTVFTIRRSVFRTRVLPAVESLADRVRRFSALIESGAEADGFARSLGAALLTPVLAELGPAVTRLIIVPDGPLHDVPWDALRLSDGRFVAERYAVSVAPAAGVVAALWGGETGRSARGAARILALGDPEFPSERHGRTREASSAATDMYALAFDSSGGLPRLRASAEEAKRVARYAPDSDVRVRGEASAAFLKRAPLRDYRVIHVATHALVDERSAARTALALAPGAGESGFVGAGDLAALTLGADLVVLSACRTARGRIVGGEGVQGLTAPLLQAGARSVVATQWRISDRKTVAFVDDFYAGLASGLPVGDALRTAKLAAIRRGAPPGEWAAFTAVGDPLVTVPLRVPPATAWARWGMALGAAAVVAALVAAIAGYVGYSRRTRRARIAEAR